MNKLITLLLLAVVLLASCVTPQAAVIETESVIATATVKATETVALTVTELPVAAETATLAAPAYDIDTVIEFEMRGAFDFFWEQANTDPESPGYGLIRDRFPGSEGVASMAAVGFGLTAYLVGIDKGYVTQDEVYERVDQTLDTLLAMDNTEGFYYHFVNMNTGKRAWDSEVSSIDTALLMMGVVSVGQYFGGELQGKADQIYERVNWPWFLDENRDMFYMAYSPENGFAGHWDFYAEQLILYILAAGSNTYPIDDSPYYEFTRDYAGYGDGEAFIHSWFGSIFTYQFSHAWIDFRESRDRDGVNWFDNSVLASLAQVAFATDEDQEYLTIGPDAWGLSASDGPNGYNGLYGAPPSGFDNQQHFIDDTVPPYGAIGSIIFTPEASQRAMMYYYSLEELKGEYGFLDAFNLTEDWYASSVIGIDKGVSLLMLSNYQDDFVHQLMMSSPLVLNGLNILEITRNP